MHQNCRNIQPVRTGHTIFAVIARNRRELQHQLGCFFQELFFFLIQRFQGRISPKVILQMFHISHSTQHTQHVGIRTGKTERPRCHTVLRATLLQARHQVVVQFRQTSSQQRLHNHSRNSTLGQLSIQIFRVNISTRSMAPIYIVHLNLHKIPFHIQRQQIIKHFHRSVK